MVKNVLGIIGGGRWGCITLKVLSKMQLQFDEIVIVTKNNATIVQELVDELQPECRISLTLISDLETLLSNYKVSAAIVVNAAPEHYATALTLIEHGVHVFVEKPITLTVAHAKLLINAALANNVCLLPGLNYRFCEYLKNFAAIVAKQHQKPHMVLLDWADSLSEVRHFNKVTYTDTRTDIAQDNMAHVWAVFSTVFNTNQITVNSCQVGNIDKPVEFLMDIDSIQTKVTMQANAAKRSRKLTLYYTNGEELTIDFNVEPGTIILASEAFSGDSKWNNRPKPLNCQYNYFFELCALGKTLEKESHACIDSMTLIERASELLQQQLQKTKNAGYVFEAPSL